MSTPDRDQTSVTRSVDGSPVLAPVRPRDVITGSVVFEWTPISDATHYVVSVYHDDGALRWTSAPLTKSTQALPPDVVLAPGRYHWRVTAYRDGSVVATATLTTIEIR